MESHCALVASEPGDAGIARFQAANPSYPATLVARCLPGDVRRDELVRSGVITPENDFGAAGLARLVAHVMLWRLCAEGGCVLHVASEEAILRGDIETQLGHIAAAASDYDMMVWGVDLAAPIHIAYAPAVEGRLLHHQTAAPPAIPVFQASRGGIVTFRLRWAGALCGYTLSPQGARAMLARCLPFGPLPTQSDGQAADTGFELAVSRALAGISAFIVQPLLAVLPVTVPAVPLALQFARAFGELAGRPLQLVPAPAPPVCAPASELVSSAPE